MGPENKFLKFTQECIWPENEFMKSIRFLNVFSHPMLLFSSHLLVVDFILF